MPALALGARRAPVRDRARSVPRGCPRSRERPETSFRAAFRSRAGSRLRSALSCPPRALGAGNASSPVQLRRLLAEVPDVPGFILCVPVGRALGETAAEVEDVPDDATLDARDRDRDVGDTHYVARAFSFLGSRVHVGGSRLEREPLVVDSRAEAGRVGAAGGAAGGRGTRA